MKYRKLGDSDLEVSEISLGSWLTYGGGVEADKARACLEDAFAQGINFIDTANVYGRGAAEAFLGEALHSRARDSYVLATKLYFPMTESDRGLSRRPVLVVRAVSAVVVAERPQVGSVAVGVTVVLTRGDVVGQ